MVATHSAHEPRPWFLGTRGSDLARTQSQHVADALAPHAPTPIQLRIIRTHGDATSAPLSSLGGTGVFATALRNALLAGDVDLVVHSLKDLPTAAAPGLRYAAIPQREDVRDALCARDQLGLADLPSGAKVGTGSPRRAAQLLAARPDLHLVDVRGNVPTRLGRVGADLDAVVLAAAGLRRLGLHGSITEYLEPEVMLPAPGQGALCVETRDDAECAGPIAAVDHLPTRLAVTAERQVLATLEAGCAAPVGALAELNETQLSLVAAVILPATGPVRLRATTTVDPDQRDRCLEQAEQLGREVAVETLGQLPDGALRADPAMLWPDRRSDQSPGPRP